MLHRPIAMPKEFVRGYLGTIMKRNGFPTEPDAMKALRNWAGDTNRSGVPKVVILAKVADMKADSFLRGHTTLALRRCITSHTNEFAHGRPESYPTLIKWAMHSGRVGAHLCEQCAAEDVDFHGYSYWRTDHQLPGLYWCPKHDVLLSFLNDERAFLREPVQCLGDAAPISNGWAHDARQNPAVKRFHELCTYLQDRPRSFAIQDILTMLRARARHIGFQVNQGGALGLLLSDYAIDMFGRQWLSTVLPDLADKPRGVPSAQLDGVLYRNTTSSSLPYVIAAATLFDTAEEAMNSFIKGDQAAGSQHQSDVGDRIDFASLFSVYVRADGSHDTAAQILSISPDSAGYHLNNAGLPNLCQGADKDLRRALTAFFLEKRSVQESASLGGIKMPMFEAILRLAGQPLRQALQELDKPTGASSAVSRKAPQV